MFSTQRCALGRSTLPQGALEFVGQERRRRTVRTENSTSTAGYLCQTRAESSRRIREHHSASVSLSPYKRKRKIRVAMAANKFATVLHRNGNKMAVVLAYAVLEWTLILLLLLNGLFAYLIARFANFFGLKPPCVFCSRVDHLFEHRADGRGRRQRGACRDLLCDDHAAEVAGMGYCARHQRLAEAGEMCEDCFPSSSRPVEAAVLSWKKRSEEGAKDLRCSCCD
ncbi:hypothetical protein GW17_00033751, partial [Ensete ventricosum]